jgi:peptidoglycan/xylan/chitin deacetylase (PgdA/CDA1 family)
LLALGKNRMKAATYITTSWDDGHPLDLRVAELLAKYGLRGTFYVPMTAETETMTAAQVRELGSAFEIGAHTLHHVDLTAATESLAWQEMVESKAWIEDVTGLPCPMFCPPKGRFSTQHLRQLRDAGYLGGRTVELLSLAFPRPRAGILLLPTTVQAHPHGVLGYAKNVIRRAAWRNLWTSVAHGRSTDWTELARSLLTRALVRGGVFHLWGHSWEIHQTGQWEALAEVLHFMSQFTRQAPPLTNWEVCQAATVRNGSVRPSVQESRKGASGAGPASSSDRQLAQGNAPAGEVSR